MTKETASELAKIFQAYSEGKQIQINKHSNDNEWDDINVISVDIYTKYLFEGIRLRIKPESKYIPFTFEDRDLFKDKWMQRHGRQNLVRICTITKNEVFWDRNNSCTYSELLARFEFEDGSPCGKLIKE